MTEKLDIIRAHDAHPNWSASDIAAHLGCGSAYVRKVASNCLIKLPRSVYRTKKVLFKKVKAAGT